MTKKLRAVLILAAVAVLCAGVAWAEEKDEKAVVWQAKSAHAMALHGGHDAMFISEDGEKFDLADLRDGETRTFGEGDKQVTVTRDGDLVTIDREERGEERKLKLRCHLGKDSCQVMTFADEPEKVMIIVKKTRECVDGEGDCEATIDVHLDDLDLGEGSHAIVREVHCNDEGECEEFEKIHGGGEVEVHADFVHPGHGNVMIMKSGEMAGDKVMLRCPEGDSTVMVDKEEAGETFLCPKHSIPMEEGPRKVLIKTLEVREEED